MLKTICQSISAGIMIAIGGSVFLSCDDRYIGAILFSVALLCICYLGFYLYTGKIAYFTEDHSPENIKKLLTGLLVNLLVTFVLGRIIVYAVPACADKAVSMCTAKLSQSFVSTLIRGLFCGILMYLAVEIFKEKKTAVGILFCIPVFILSGFEHSIADMFYFGAAGFMSGAVVRFEIAAVLGNTFGSMILPLLKKFGEKDEKN